MDGVTRAAGEERQVVCLLQLAGDREGWHSMITSVSMATTLQYDKVKQRQT